MKLSVDGSIRQAVYAAFAAGVASVAGPAVAQEATAPAEVPAAKSVELEKVKVTGTRIRAPNLTSASPITTVNSQEIQYQGTTRVEDLLNSLPQVFAGQGATISNGASGTATVDLRGLGPERTLVLIDGRRLPPGDPAQPVADLNFIPSSLVDRIDVSTGGASAVYGSDAIAGVVNFVMKRDFEGVSLDLQRSGYYHNNDNKEMQDLNAARGFTAPSGSTFDGKGWDLTGVLGFNTSDGKGNATTYVTYRNNDPITQDGRDYSNCTLEVRGSKRRCGGSLTSATGAFIADGFEEFGYIGTVDTDPETGEAVFRAFDDPGDRFNYAPYNYYQRNDERYGMGAFAHYEFNKHADVYTDLMYMADQTNAVIAPSGAFGNSYLVPCNGSNPLISGAQLDMLCAPFGGASPDSTESAPIYYILRRNVEGGGRDDDLTHTSQRIVVGVKGDIVNSWSYDAYMQYGQSTLAEIYRNDFSKVRIGRALDVIDVGGQAVCRSAVDGQIAPDDPTKGATDPNCVPWNIWSPGGVTPEALAYLQTPGILTGHTEQRIASASVSGDLGLGSPFASDVFGVAFGAEYRHEQTVYDPDVSFTTGDLAGQGAATIGTGGSYYVKELFSELRLPIAQDKPFVKELSVELGYRWSDYSSLNDTVGTYKFGINYAPVKDVALRASYNRATRAPNIIESFAPIRVALDGSSDPCAGDTPDPGCVNDPLYATKPELFDNAEILPNPAGQYNGLLGTTPGDMSEEKSDSYTYGLVFTPSFVKGLAFTVDYYDIKVKNLIGEYGADTILESCYATGQFCDLIQRNPSNGSLWQGNGYVVDYTLNTGSLQVKGVDITSSYKTTFAKLGLPDLGRLTFDLVATNSLNYTVQPITNGESYECAGAYGTKCGTPTPEWRGKFRTTWGMPWMDSKLSVQWRYFDSVTFDGGPTTYGLSPSDQKLGTQSYLDLYASTKPIKNLTLEAGINNVLDREPPLNALGLGNGNSYSQVYDSLGMYLFGGVRVEF
ncbi:MAG: TonB-dependent receptor [Nevskiaceae bacterium]|nr:MAG: TonB-dependent receptor [Nevskiaceae bacterium]TAM23073.1 MAG: TonB-dependent receptor [Nevskiaceae bacterium]